MDCNRPWCCMGDFNEMALHFEKDGIRPFDHYRAELFRNILTETGLMDMDLKGCKFTWVSNPRNRKVTREKLERVLVNWPWRSFIPHALAIALPIVSSDHSPMIFQVSSKEKSGISFKYEAYWEKHLDCNEVINRGWAEGEESNMAWGTFIEKMKTCKKRLQRWNKEEFKRANRELAKLKGHLK